MDQLNQNKWETEMIEVDGKPCLVLPDELCKKLNIGVGTVMDIKFDSKKEEIIMTIVKRVIS